MVFPIYFSMHSANIGNKFSKMFSHVAAKKLKKCNVHTLKVIVVNSRAKIGLFATKHKTEKLHKHEKTTNAIKNLLVATLT